MNDDGRTTVPAEDRSVLIAYDGRCPTTLRAGAAFARATGAGLTVATAYHYRPVSTSARALPDPVPQARALALLDRAAAGLTGLEVTVRAVAATDVREALLDLAAEIDAEAIVLGPDLHGDITRSITAAAERPVLAVPELPQGVAAVYRRIGVAYDASVASRFALDAAAVLARRTGAALELVSVGPDAGHPGDLALQAEQAAARLEVDVTVEVLFGDPGPRLREAATRYDLLVCGTRRRARVLRAILGSVSSELLALPHCPTLLIPPATRLHDPAPQTGSSAQPERPGAQLPASAPTTRSSGTTP